MLLRIPALLTPEEVATCRQTLEQAPWEDGRATAGQLAAQVKHNLQLPLASEAAKTLGEFLLNKLAHNPLYLSAALPLWGFDRSDTTTAEKLALVEAQLYDKGPLLLHELAERTGSRRFFDLCRAMQWSEVRTTAHFLDLLEEVEDHATRLWMEEMLKTP